MQLRRRCAVIGTAICAPDKNDPRSLEELLYDVVQAALKDAGLTIGDIDGIVVGSNDEYDGRAISIMAASGSVGGVDRDILSTPSAGEHALVMATLRVASGLYETHLVVSWSPTEASSLSEAQRLGNDPYYHRRLPLDENSSMALQAVAMAAATPSVHETATILAALNRDKGASIADGRSLKTMPSGKLPWPLKKDMVSSPATGVTAVVIASSDFVRDRAITDIAWINGMGWATEAAFLGDRNLNETPALNAARESAYAQAGLTDPLETVQVAEITDATPYQALLVAEGLLLSPRAKWIENVRDGLFTGAGAVRVNPSGGVANFNAVFCNGLLRIAEAANQVRGKAGAHQVPNVKSAIAHGASGFAMMYQTVLVLGAELQGDNA